MNTVEKLQAAKEILLAKQWTKGAFRDDAREAFCSVGACYEALGCEWMASEHVDGGWAPKATGYDEIDLRAPLMFLQTAIAKHINDDSAWAVPEFNDHPDTTFNDVMDVFDEAILLAKEASV